MPSKGKAEYVDMDIVISTCKKATDVLSVIIGTELQKTAWTYLLVDEITWVHRCKTLTMNEYLLTNTILQLLI